MTDVSVKTSVRFQDRLRNIRRVFSSDLVKLFVITSSVMIYAVVFRESRGLGLGVFSSTWMLSAAASTTWGKLMLSLSLATVVVLWKSKWQRANRRGFPDLRMIVFPVILVLAWPFSVYEYNYFLNQTHLADRTGVVVLALLTVYRPMFLGLFITQLGVVLGHFNFPLTFSWTDKSPLIDVLLLTQLYLLGARVGWLRANHFLWGSFWIIAVHYVRPGIGKLEMGWLQENNLENLVMGAIHQNSWLCFGFDDAQRATIVASVAILSPLLMFAALVVELLPMVYFSGRRILLIGLASAIAMHLAIFASSGIFFWKWIVLDLALMAVVLRLPDSTGRRLFQIRHHIVFCLFLVPSCLLYATAPKLAWFDAPLCQRYHIEIVGKSGSVYQVPPSKLAPFDLQFAQGRLFFADSDPMIVDCFGSCNRVQILRSAEAIHTGDDLRRFQSTMGQAKYNAQLSFLLQRTLRNYLQENSVERQVPVFGLLPDPPQHIWTFPDPNLNQDVWNWQELAKEIRIRKLTVSHLEGEVKPIQEKTVLRIAVE